MALSPKDQERIIEEEKLRFKIRQDLHAQACAEHPRRGRWLWILALVVLGWVLFHHARYCGRGCMMGGMGCQHGMMMGGMACHHPWMDGQEGMAPPMPDADADAKAPAAAPKAAPKK